MLKQALLVAVVVLLSQTQVGAADFQIYVTTEVGREVAVGKYTLFPADRSCATDPTRIEVKITTQPAHGKVAVRNEDYSYDPAQTQRDYQPRCLGAQVSGWVVYYTSDANYSGPDDFEFSVTSPSRSGTREVIVTVKGAATAPPSAIPTPSKA